MRDADTVRTTLEIDDDVLQAAKELAEARGTTTGKVVSELLRRALALDPSQGLPHCQLAIVILRQGRASEAEAFARFAVQLDSANSSNWTRLGECLAAQRRWSDAAQALAEATRGNPQDAESWLLLARAEQSRENLDAALAAYARCLGLAPDNDEALACYADLLCRRGQQQQARAAMQGFLSRSPDRPAGWLELGLACEQLGFIPEAEAAFRRTVQVRPRDPAGRYVLARLLHNQLRIVEAEAAVRQLLTEQPEDAAALALLGQIQQTRGEPETAIATLRRAVARAPEPFYHSKLPLISQYADRVDPAELLAEHRRFDIAYARHLAPASPPSKRQRAHGEKLRLGFVSSDFGQHPTGYLVLPALECLDKQRFSITCYFDRSWEDEHTQRFRAAADQWRAILQMSDEEVAQQIRTDQIDVLFDLTGHVGSRLLVFARRPAPVQIAWFGYPGTTGLKAMDFLLADRFHVRPGEEAGFSERILRMPNGYACYDAIHDAPPVGPLPAIANGLFTFGCFNNPSKFGSRILDAWAAILQRLPSARLLLKFGWLDEAPVQQSLRAKLVTRGAQPEQVLIEGFTPHQQFLANYGRVDLALDTQPYSGGVTTCESLWMGVPVITCPGRTLAGRHTTSHLTNAGFPQFIAADLDRYVDFAVEWAGRLNELAAIRASLRDRMQTSPLCDAPRFARDLGALIEEAWTTVERATAS